MCVCVHKSLEGRVGKLYRKFVFSKVNGQPGYREDWILNTFLFSFFKYSCICVVQSCLKYLMPKLLSLHSSFLFKECVCYLYDSNLVATTVNMRRFAFV